ncbi:uncharacterized protein LOC134283814 [Saccostrea cucullata]|uniref:uncharacterized protein LOC134283814 n=1 Tax=Saccostrea cuccullata TaxID=36930 RepID=UPI002ED62923
MYNTLDLSVKERRQSNVNQNFSHAKLKERGLKIFDEMIDLNITDAYKIRQTRDINFRFDQSNSRTMHNNPSFKDSISNVNEALPFCSFYFNEDEKKSLSKKVAKAKIQSVYIIYLTLDVENNEELQQTKPFYIDDLTSWQIVDISEKFLEELPIDFDLITLNLFWVDDEIIKDHIKLRKNITSCQINPDQEELIKSIERLLWNEILANSTSYLLCNRRYVINGFREFIYYLTTVWIGYDLECSAWPNERKTLKKTLPEVIAIFCYILSFQFVWIFSAIDVKYKRIGNKLVPISRYSRDKKYDFTEETDYQEHDRPCGIKRILLKLFYGKCCTNITCLGRVIYADIICSYTSMVWLKFCKCTPPRRLIALIWFFIIFPSGIYRVIVRYRVFFCPLSYLLTYIFFYRPLLSSFTFILRFVMYFAFVTLAIRIHLFRYTLITVMAIVYFVRYLVEIINMKSEILKYLFKYIRKKEKHHAGTQTTEVCQICAERVESTTTKSNLESKKLESASKSKTSTKTKMEPKTFDADIPITTIKEELYNEVTKNLLFAKRKKYFFIMKSFIVVGILVVMIMIFYYSGASKTARNFKEMLELVLFLISPFAISLFVKTNDKEILSECDKKDIEIAYDEFVNVKNASKASDQPLSNPPTPTPRTYNSASCPILSFKPQSIPVTTTPTVLRTKSCPTLSGQPQSTIHSIIPLPSTPTLSNTGSCSTTSTPASSASKSTSFDPTSSETAFSTTSSSTTPYHLSTSKPSSKATPEPQSEISPEDVTEKTPLITTS